MHASKGHEVTIVLDSRVVGQGLKALDLAMLQEVSSNGCKAGICLPGIFSDGLFVNASDSWQTHDNFLSV